MKKTGIIFTTSILSGLLSIIVFNCFFRSKDRELLLQSHQNLMLPVSMTGVSPLKQDFVDASERSINAVVHVKNLAVGHSRSPFDYIFGGGYSYQIGTGSGVIVTPDGYIVTNNHVIENAEELEVTLNNNKSYPAKIIGTDPETDVALIKIDSDETLPTLVFGDSDSVKVGEWVLAVGNPFNLTSTVTAGIISAKARDLNTKDRKNQSFIQTDAAVNPGNSGGALVNIKGELIGINTAIQSRDGSYIGYSFAVPSNIAKKVIQDLMEYGSVQRVVLGVSGLPLNSSVANNLNIKEYEGYYIYAVEEGSGAEKGGLKHGDIIKEIDRIKINKFSDMTGYLSSKRPKDVVSVKVVRKGKLRSFDVKLTKSTSVAISEWGFSVRNMTKAELEMRRLKNGVKITHTFSRTGDNLIGKIVVAVNNVPISSADQLKDLAGRSRAFGHIYITLISENGEREQLIIQ